MNDEYKDFEAKRKQRQAAIEAMIVEAKKKLLPCPFCGDVPIVDRGWNDTLANPSFFASCDCMDEGPAGPRRGGNVSTPVFRDLKLVIKTWNRRVTITDNSEAT
jgi:hypothetical protein